MVFALLAAVSLSLIAPSQVVGLRVNALELFANGLNIPVSFEILPDGSFLYAELKTGNVRLLSQHGEPLDPLVTVQVADGPETGLLGLVLDPHFSTHGWFYIYYTTENSQGTISNVVQAFHLEPDNANITDTRWVLRELPAWGWHNGGALVFGPDELLYVAVGDNTFGWVAQDKDSLAGKILRVKPEGTIPESNPFPASPIYALGLRNVFGMDFHPLAGELFAAENGPKTDDEINVIRAGKNYGWPIFTGIVRDEKFNDPIHVINPSVGVTALRFYPVKASCNVNPVLLYGEFNTGRIVALHLDGPLFDRVVGIQEVAKLPEGVLDIDVSQNGTIYASTWSSIWSINPENLVTPSLSRTQICPNQTFKNLLDSNSYKATLAVLASLSIGTLCLLLIARFERSGRPPEDRPQNR